MIFVLEALATCRCDVVFDSTISHVTEWNIIQLIDVEVISTSSARTELHLNRVCKNAAAVSRVV